ncbi:hypothetical protein [Candidatus Electronema sp. TJ]|uniref:hypothetical protein n=1 Tax=Candidatus Electronema sp. TJ TaxID=3401573 RepID=UPI003AA7CD3C
MRNIADKLKPGVSRSMHLFAAPLLWTAVGIMLMERGLGWMGLHVTLRLLLIALLAGTAKSLTVLDKTAKKVLSRIMGFSDNTCIGAVYPWKTWLLVLMMMACGIALRIFFKPSPLLGAVYFAIGWALLLSSRHGWAQWLNWLRRR